MPSNSQSNLRPVQPVQRPRINPARQPPRPARPLNPQDIRKTKEYKVAARRWLSTIVALPIVMYTSWILYERVYGNKSPRRLIPPPLSQQDSSPSASSSSPPSSS